MTVEWIGGEPTQRYCNDELVTTEWKRTFVILPKKSINDAPIRPCSFAYTRQREAFSNGQRLLFTDWLTEPGYTMMLLKGEKD